MKEKPEIIGNKQIKQANERVLSRHGIPTEPITVEDVIRVGDELRAKIIEEQMNERLEAQRDADVAWFENALKTHKKYKGLLAEVDQAKAHLALTQLAAQQARTEVAREIFGTYDAYIKLLVEEIDTLSPLAIAHGWRSVRIEAGDKCRADIQSLKDKFPKVAA